MFRFAESMDERRREIAPPICHHRSHHELLHKLLKAPLLWRQFETQRSDGKQDVAAFINHVQREVDVLLRIGCSNLFFLPLIVMEELTKDLERVVGLYEVELEKANQRQEFECGPWLFAKGISLMIFDTWSQTVSRVWKIAFVEEGGKVFLYGDPLLPHSCAAGWLISKIISKIALCFGEEVSDELYGSTDMSFTIPRYGVKQPDMCILGCGRLFQTPLVVAEVGYKNERNFNEVLNEVDLWVRTGAPVVIGMKITDHGMLGSVENPRIELIVKVQGRADQSFDLSSDSPNPCVSCGTHMIVIPCEVLLTPSQLAHGPGPSALSIDLFYLQRGVREWIRQQASIS